MHEFKVLNSTASVDQLRKALKADDLEKFGEPFTPEFVYEAIRLLSRFASMRVCLTLGIPSKSFLLLTLNDSAVISKMLKSS